MMLATTAFEQLKRESLRKLRAVEDKSPKGSVDAPILELIRTINDHPDYVTSSSCSGRIALFCGVAAGSALDVTDETGVAASGSDHLITKGGKWLLAEHATVSMETLRNALRVSTQPASFASNMIIFKHEPFIMHVVCRDVDAAKELLQWGLSCGFRESGIVLGNKKIMCAIRTTANAMEIPLGRSVQELLVNETYLQWLLDIANDKFEANRKKTDQLFAAFKTRFLDVPAPKTGPTVSQKALTSTISLRGSRALANNVLLQRLGHSSVAYHNDVYVFGGQAKTSAGTLTRVDELLKVSIDKDNFVTLMDAAGAPSSRMHHSAVVVGEQMVVFGGRAGPLHCYNDVYAFEFATQTWRPVEVRGEVAPAPRWKHTACAVGNVLYVHGGRDAATVFSDLYALDFGQTPLMWRKIEPAEGIEIPPRFDHTGVVVAETQLLFWGGLWSLEDIQGNNRAVCTVYDTMSGQWGTRAIKNPTSGPLPALTGASSAVVDDAHVVVCGGASPKAALDETTPQALYALNFWTMEWQRLGTTVTDQTSYIYATCTWLVERSALVVLGGGFQCFGFGQVLSASGVCELVVVRKNEKDKVMAPSTRSTPPTSTPTTTTHKTEQANATPSTKDDSAPPSAPVLDMSHPWGVLAEKAQVKAVKTRLEQANVYDKTRRVHIVPDRTLPKSGGTAFLLPVTTAFEEARRSYHDLRELQVILDEDAYANKFGKASGLNRNDVIQRTVLEFAKRHRLPEALLSSIPDRYEFVGDVLLVPMDTFLEPEWSSFANDMWKAVCASTTPRLSRVARKAFIDPSEKRQSHVELLFMNPAAMTTHRKHIPGWVEVRENGITYGWDLTKVMFSSGNVTEKARMAKIGCANEIIVDLFCGIGYYVLPFLVHGGAAFVHACEWNPDSVDALKFNLERNHVADRCRIYEGDNQLNAPGIGAVADRVNLGLLPTSEKAWPLAVQVLKHSGGWMHVHDNVAVEDRARWEAHVVASIRSLGEAYGKHWHVSCEHVERVKSYAPKVHHLVADIRCVAI
ncbi:hypothetical protein Poli38472_006119 [Pythium oligandrum]|uniref:tRNA wybutosine-synthesizing protein 3 n=1 Tax=Pythium oligandrum TaxID=41045 RepID=A0A8K1CU40_PYTOL|nr:hypothetical protein Poli38472_006119 [Pythium oligandrum]|eukprot:TMW68651.1 hypothetical protein Poli38472_006119 [Pythium oligandrum]